MYKNRNIPDILNPFLENLNPHLAAVIEGIRFEIIGASWTEIDLLDACKVEAESWGAGTKSEKAIAFQEADIVNQFSSFPGLNVIAKDESTGRPVGSAFLGRLPAGTDVINVPDSAQFIASMIPDGPLFEGVGIAVARDRRGEGLGVNLILAGQWAVANKILAEAYGKYGSYSEIQRNLDAVMSNTDSTASVRVNAYDAWLKENGLENSEVNLLDYYTLVCSGRQFDPVLSMNLFLKRRTGDLTSIISLKGGCYEDKDSAKAGLRTRRIKLVRVMTEALLAKRGTT